MKIKLPNKMGLFVGVITLFGIFFDALSQTTNSQTQTIPQVPGWLTSGKLQQQLQEKHDQLLTVRDQLNAHVIAHNAKCSSYEIGSALESECLKEAAQIETERANYRAMKKEFINTIDSLTKERDAEIDAKLEKIDEQVEVLQQALRGLNDSMKLDADQRKEWENKSTKASYDAWVLASGMALDKLSTTYKGQLEEADAEVKSCVDKLTGTTDPDRREQLHTAFSILERNKQQIQAVVDSTERAKIEFKALKSLASDSESKPNPIETAFSLANSLKVVPPWASATKTAVDAWYDVAVQAVSVQHIGALNAHSDDYLKNVNILSKKLEATVKQKKALEALKN